MSQPFTKAIAIFLTAATLLFIVFGYPGGNQFESKVFHHAMEEGARLNHIPQKDQPDEFIIRFNRSNLKDHTGLIFRSSSRFSSTFFLEIQSTSDEVIKLFSPGLGARNDFVVDFPVNDGCQAVEIQVRRQDTFSENQINVLCDTEIIRSFSSPNFIFTRVEAGIDLEYSEHLNHFTGNLALASLFHLLTLVTWIAITCWLFPSGVKRHRKFRKPKLHLIPPVFGLFVLGLATLTMPALVDDGSVLSIIKNFRATSGSTNNIFSASALEWPVGSGAIAILNFVIGANPSMLVTRLPILASFIASIFFLYLISLRTRDNPQAHRTAPTLLFASFTSILVGWGVTLRLEFLLLPIACLMLFLIIDLHDRATEFKDPQHAGGDINDINTLGIKNRFAREILAISFLGGLAVSVTQAGLSIFFSAAVAVLQILRLMKFLNFKVITFSIIFCLLGFVSAQPWIPLRQFLRITENFRAANGTLHSTTVLREIDRYASAMNGSALRSFGVFLILLGLICCIVLIATRTSRQSAFVGSVVLSAHVGLAFTSSRWMWHLIVLAPFTAISLHVTWLRLRSGISVSANPTLAEHPLTVRQRVRQVYSFGTKRWPTSMFIFALVFLSLVAIERTTRPLIGSTPNLRDPAALERIQGRINALLDPTIGPVPLIIPLLFAVSFLLIGISNRHFETAGNVVLSIPFLAIFFLSFLPLFTSSLRESAPSHIGLPLYELTNGEKCGWLSSFAPILLPAEPDESETTVKVSKQLEAARLAIQSIQWSTSSDYYLKVPAGHSILMRNHPGSEGRLELENVGVFNLRKQSFSESSMLHSNAEDRTLYIKVENADLALLDTRDWEYTELSTIVRNTNGLTDPVFHTLTPCVSTRSNDGLTWNRFDWTISNPLITDLGQSAPLDIGLRMAGEFGIFRMSCPTFGETLDTNQCFYLYLDT